MHITSHEIQQLYCSLVLKPCPLLLNRSQRSMSVPLAHMSHMQNRRRRIVTDSYVYADRSALLPSANLLIHISKSNPYRWGVTATYRLLLAARSPSIRTFRVSVAHSPQCGLVHSSRVIEGGTTYYVVTGEVRVMSTEQRSVLHSVAFGVSIVQRPIFGRALFQECRVKQCDLRRTYSNGLEGREQQVTSRRQRVEAEAFTAYMST